MDDTAKYLIHAAITADGVVERSDVVGAIFGQTEGLLGDDLDLRDLQQSSKVGRIDVQIQSENGQSYGEVTIASSLDKVETSILAASLETIARVGPCQATVEVTDIEDVRAAKRREVVERAKELLADSFDESVMTSREILEEVRESVRVDDITEYKGYPAGPNVDSSDAIIVVEGRADVLTLLRYGIKNGIAVEGTNVPDVVAALTQERNVTAFLDGDRGGELILRELAQVGAVDYVAFAPRGHSVEDLARHEVMSALRDKVPYETLEDDTGGEQAVTATDGSTAQAPEEAVDPRVGLSATTESSAAPASEPSASEDSTTGTASTTNNTSTSTSANTATAEADASTTEAHTTHTTDASGATHEQPASPAVPTNGDADSRTDDTVTVEPIAHEPDGKPSEREGASGQPAETVESDDPDDAEATDESDGERTVKDPTLSLREHVRQVVGSKSATVRLLDETLAALGESPAADAFDAVAGAETAPYALVVDGEVNQRLVDIAAQRGVTHIVGRTAGEYVKKPVGVRVRTAEQLSNN